MTASFGNVEVEGKNTVCVSLDVLDMRQMLMRQVKMGSCWWRSVSHGQIGWSKSSLGVKKIEAVCFSFLSFLLATNFKRRHLGHSTIPRFSNNDDFLLLTNQEFFITSTYVKEPISFIVLRCRIVFD